MVGVVVVFEGLVFNDVGVMLDVVVVGLGVVVMCLLLVLLLLCVWVLVLVYVLLLLVLCSNFCVVWCDSVGLLVV